MTRNVLKTNARLKWWKFFIFGVLKNIIMTYSQIAPAQLRCFVLDTKDQTIKTSGSPIYCFLFVVPSHRRIRHYMPFCNALKHSVLGCNYMKRCVFKTEPVHMQPLTISQILFDMQLNLKDSRAR